MQERGSATCPACHTAQAGLPFSPANGYRIFECARCGLSFCDPMRAADADFYAANEQYDDKWEFDVVAGKLSAMPGGLNVLDIGCGDGRFLEKIGSRHRVRGVDFNPRAVRAAREKGLDVHALSLDEFRERFPDATHDVVTLFHVLEHVTEPSAFIETLKKSLKPDARVVISVPNPSRWTLYWGRETWDHPPHHLTRWTTGSLRAFLDRHGFEILETRGEPVRSWNQVRGGVADLVWAFVLGNMAFGVATRLASTAHGSPVPAGSTRAALAGSLSALKSGAVGLLVWTIAAVSYPYFRLREAEGKSLLVWARLSPAA